MEVEGDFSHDVSVVFESCIFTPPCFRSNRRDNTLPSTAVVSYGLVFNAVEYKAHWWLQSTLVWARKNTQTYKVKDLRMSTIVIVRKALGSTAISNSG